MVRGIGLRYGVSVAALLAASTLVATTAQAGSFGIREQSTYYQGMSFAGEAVGNDLSSMFWNPAATGSMNGINSSSNFTAVVADSQMHANTPAGADSGDISDLGVVPASYFNYQVNNRLYLGMSVNAPYAFTTKPDNTWAGSSIATTSHVSSINVTPTVAYKLTPSLTVGAGVQVEYFNVSLKNGAYPANPGAIPGRTIEGDDIGVGFTAGVIWKPAAGTQIGLGYRSAVDVTLEGRCSGYAITNLAGGTPGCTGGKDVTADITLPDIVSLGLKQQITDKVAFLGTVEWTQWSTVDVVNVNSGGTTVDRLAFNYKDGWLFSGGLEYAYNPFHTFRTGIAWEKSPITDENRSVLIPDADRWWLSVGSSHKLSDRMTLELAYTHIIVDDATIKTSSFTAESDTKINIVSLGVKYKWGDVEPELEPLK